MTTGQRPFAGDTNLSILSSILKDTPKSRNGNPSGGSAAASRVTSISTGT